MLKLLTLVCVGAFMGATVVEVLQLRRNERRAQHKKQQAGAPKLLAAGGEDHEGDGSPRRPA